MATDFHKVSVITNSSVKPPVKSQNGYPNTLHERIQSRPDWEYVYDTAPEPKAEVDKIIRQKIIIF